MKFIILIVAVSLGVAQMAGAREVTRKPNAQGAASCDEILTALAGRSFSECTYSRGGEDMGYRDMKLIYAKDSYSNGAFFATATVSIGRAGLGLFELGEGSEDKVECPSDHLVKYKTKGGRVGSIELDNAGKPTVVRKIGKDVAKIICQ